jgi:protease I
LAKKILMIIAPKNFRDEELQDPKLELEAAGASVTIASKKTGSIRGMLGARVDSEVALDDVNVDDYDAIIFVGGIGASTYFNDGRALSITKDAFRKGKKICAICIAPVILANAGVLKGKRATSFEGEYKRALEARGATYTGTSVEVDGNVVTAFGPAAAREFGRTIARELGL